jgi:hypothetical protein
MWGPVPGSTSEAGRIETVLLPGHGGPEQHRGAQPTSSISSPSATRSEPSAAA